ncbi:MAG: S8 family serine peptidase, partial [Thermoplasmata archaeon]
MYKKKIIKFNKFQLIFFIFLLLMSNITFNVYGNNDTDLKYNIIVDVQNEQDNEFYDRMTQDINIVRDRVNMIDAILFEDSSVLNHLSSQNELTQFEIIENYGSFCQLKISESQFTKISNLGYIIQSLQDLNMLRFGYFNADTEEHGEGLSELFGQQWRRSENQVDEEDYYIVQFKGPIKDEWLKQLEQSGITLLDAPVDYYAHLIRMHSSKVELLKSYEFVSWVDYYHPALRMRGGLELELDELTTSTEPIDVVIIFFRSITQTNFFDKLNHIEKLGGRINQIELENRWWYSAKVTTPKSLLAEVASLSGVNYIHPCGERRIRNDDARWVVQSFNASGKSTPVWDAGLHGEGIVVGMADTGIDYDHIVFRHNDTSAGTPNATHRKLVRYNTDFDDWDYEGNVDSGHGTHTAASIIGDSLTTPGGYDTYDGMAYGARMAFYDIVKSGNNWNEDWITDYFDDAYEVGARSHSDSWGDDFVTYTDRSERCDQYQWDHYDFLIFIAPGNTGKILEPATAKNVVGVGNAVNGNSDDLVSGSGKGPTLEGMISPTILAPGGSVRSADSDGIKDSLNSGYISMSGTSMATPIAAGTTALVEQYFKEGFYPEGKKNAAYGFMPSGPLKKAMIVNSGWDMYGGSNINSHIPDNSQGWGKIKLDDVLYFEGDRRELWVDDRYNLTNGKEGLKTGNTSEYFLYVNSTEPFEITVVWNDYPGAGLKNDLDLIVTAPDSKKYLGNVYQNGESTTGGTKDSKNPIESVYFKNPKEGFYQIKVQGTNIAAGGSQNFAIVATGEFNDEGKGFITLNATKYGSKDTVGITLIDTNLAGAGTASVSVSSTLESDPETVSLTESTNMQGKFTGGIKLSLGTPVKDSQLQVTESDKITVNYVDTDPLHLAIAEALVDMKPPTITASEIVKIDSNSFVMFWSTDEPSTGELWYGTSYNTLDKQINSSDLSLDHTIEVTDLDKDTLYFYKIISYDDIGNIMVEDNSGSCYSLLTATYQLTPDINRVGWVQEGEDFNHFNDGKMSVGVSNNKIRLGAIQFDLVTLPDDLRIYTAHLNLFGHDKSELSSTGGNWYAEILNSSIDIKFNGTTTSPVYNDIKSTAISSRFNPAPKEITPGNVRDNFWHVLKLNTSDRMKIEARIASNAELTVRLSGPDEKTGVDNLFRWDTGYYTASGSYGEKYKPQ